MSLYSALARPILFALDAERAHDVTMAALQRPLASSLLKVVAAPVVPALRQQIFGLSFTNPVGLAAGLDKQGVAVPAWSALGFGFAEIGTVTPRPQPGNPKPRLFRLPADRAVINRFGFNSEGAVAVAENLSQPGHQGPACRELRLGINIGKNKETPNDAAVDDCLRCVDALHAFADYFVINVSSPNTAGLRTLQASGALRPLVEQVVMRVKTTAGREVPVLVKMSPDMSEADLIASVAAAVEGGATGVIATNTTTSRSGLTTHGSPAGETGGLSGAPLTRAANDACRALFRHLGRRIPNIGVGGIFNADDAYARVRAGASLIQVYTGFIYEGPQVVSRIVTGLAARLERDGFSSLADAVGIDART